MLAAVILTACTLSPVAVSGESPDTAGKALQELTELAAARPPEQTGGGSESAAWRDQQSEQVAGRAEAFYARYPEDPRRWQAVALYLRASLYASDEKIREVRMQRAMQLADQALQAADIVDGPWSQALEWKFYRVQQDRSGADPVRLRALLDEMTRRLPQSDRLRGLEAQYVEVLLRRDEPAAEVWLDHLAASANAGVARQAAGMLRLRGLRNEPVQLRFTAIDGREVDLAAMRGKVVLVDFWATWCGPCLAEMPNVKRVYDAYHAQGFEVVGIALDKAADLDKVKAAIIDLDTEWPQFLDMDNARNRFASELGITSIPAPLLFDRNGLLVSDRARGKRLEPEVQRLLAP